jgi:DNA-binding transcriptional regulator LsrR (DeoR family)
MTKTFYKHRLSDKQLRAWRLRYRNGWRLKHIALEMGISISGASRLLQRAQVRAGIGKCRITVFKKKPRVVRAVSLSNVFHY